ncbi:hypothetical protein CCACVL1_05272 [Corchorus capsularis]|uniref:Uncharacterized protein n=1 Tax=Corchorus capsularis TaxID=210143 RepID=A0A1R3JLQ8_COCAP|nr:hypothetical protein CCACVL1_05272 [Corchorus capsularis]
MANSYKERKEQEGLFLLTSSKATLPLVLKACAKLKAVETGKRIHWNIRSSNLMEDVRVGTALIDFYCKCGFLEDARKVFDEMVERDLVSWNAMISGCVGCGRFGEVFFLVMSMQREGFSPNSRTLVAMLLACEEVVEVRLGKEIHGYCLRNGLFLDPHVGTALIGFYLSFNVRASRVVFDLMAVRNTVCWNAMIKGYFDVGENMKALKLFEKMLMDGVEFDTITMLALIQASAEFGSLGLESADGLRKACSHSGMIEEGLQLFDSMIQEFRITPQLAHYGCVVDLLGRAGRLDEARKFIESMPIKPDASVWRALLSAYRDDGYTKDAKAIFDKIVELEPMNPGNYILLCNLYAAAGLWSEAKQIRINLREKGLRKPPGISWIVVRSQVHSFAAGDISHPMADKIYANLNSLLHSMKEIGYVPDLRWILHVDEEYI